MNICKLENCNNKVSSKSMCSKHYQRERKYGDANKFVHERSLKGEPLKFFLDSLKLDVDRCIEWPYSLRRGGYGCLQIGNKTRAVHRLALETKIGKSDKNKPFILHSCGNRKCFNTNHLRFGTAAENAQDRDNDGTTCRGTDKWNNKLTENDVREIRKDTRTNIIIAAEYGVAKENISAIKRYRIWRWLK